MKPVDPDEINEMLGIDQTEAFVEWFVGKMLAEVKRRYEARTDLWMTGNGVERGDDWTIAFE